MNINWVLEQMKATLATIEEDGNKMRKGENEGSADDRSGERTGPNLIRNIIREIVSTVSTLCVVREVWLSTAAMGILRDNWRFHTLTSPLLFSTDELERTPAPHKSKYFIIIKDIFLSSFKDFTIDRTQVSILNLLHSPLFSVPFPSTKDGNRFSSHNKRIFPPGW